MLAHWTSCVSMYPEFSWSQCSITRTMVYQTGNQATHQQTTTEQHTETKTKTEQQRNCNNNKIYNSNNPSLLLQHKKEGFSSIVLWNRVRCTMCDYPPPNCSELCWNTHHPQRSLILQYTGLQNQEWISPIKNAFCVCVYYIDYNNNNTTTATTNYYYRALFSNQS